MTTINVQFTDSSDATIGAYFAGPQDAALYPNQGKVEASDARWKTYFDSQAFPVQTGMPAPG